MSWLSTFLKPAPVEQPPITGGIRLEETLQHPEITLFESRAVARTQAEELGAPWVAMSFACGYILTDGWNFRDAQGSDSDLLPGSAARAEGDAATGHRPAAGEDDRQGAFEAGVFGAPRDPLPENHAQLSV